MIAEKIADFFYGYVVITAQGLSPEKLINLCLQNNIKIRDVTRLGYTEIQMRLSFSGYRKIKKLSDNKKYKMYIKKVGGIPLRIVNAKKRMAVLPAILFLVIVLICSTEFVWDVKYTGFDSVNQFEVQEMLENMGLQVGTQKSEIDRGQAEKAVLANFKDLAWVNIYFKGTQLIINVVESTKPEKGVETSGISDVYAKKDGFIEDMRVYAGTAAASEGQTVQKGQLLISGDIIYKERLVMQLHARGDVLAKTTYWGNASGPLLQKVAQKTGNVYNMKYIRLGNNFYPLTKDHPNYAQFSAEINHITVAGQNMPAFFKIYDLTISETQLVDVPIKEEVLYAGLKEEAYRKAVSSVPDEQCITGVHVIAKKDDDNMQVLVIIEALEDISEVRAR